MSHFTQPPFHSKVAKYDTRNSSAILTFLLTLKSGLGAQEVSRNQVPVNIFTHLATLKSFCIFLLMYYTRVKPSLPGGAIKV